MPLKRSNTGPADAVGSKIAEYRRLLEQHEHGARDQRLLAHSAGRTLVATLPSTKEIRAVVRRHLDVTLALADMSIRLGPVKLSGTYTPLNAHFEPTVMLDEKERYVLYSQFEIKISAPGGFRDRVLVDDRNGRWGCWSWGISRDHIERAIRRPSQRVVVITVKDQRTADRIARAARSSAIDVSISSQIEWDRAQQTFLRGALRSCKPRATKLTKAERAHWNAEVAQAFTALDERDREIIRRRSAKG